MLPLQNTLPNNLLLSSHSTPPPLLLSFQAYEAEKMRLTEAAKLPGVKGLQATHQLHQLGPSCS